jgi:saccharopine dehydrogenase-like NADP-dependent oxidoreductase
MKRVVVLGSGLVGAVMAADLAGDADLAVSVADVRGDALARAADRARGRITTLRADLADPVAIRKLVEPFDLVVGALASHLGFAALRAVIEAGKSYCDISFMPEDAWDLDALAKEQGVTAIVDCGVAPGMSNLLAARGAALMDRCASIDIMVGGLPRHPEPPFLYKAGFAPADVIEEYTRPSRVVEGGRIVLKDALSEPELVDLPHAGRLEAVNTDGLRSLAYFLKVPNMRERTLRYPGHYDIMRAFRAAGLFAKEPVTLGGVSVIPLELTSKLLFPLWQYSPGEEDLTVMRVVAEGERAGRPARACWDLHDVYDRASGATSMSRTTGLTCTTFARMLLRGEIAAKGVVTLEQLGADGALVDGVLDALAAKGIRYEATRD